VDGAVDRMRAIVLAERSRRESMEQEVREIVAAFLEP